VMIGVLLHLLLCLLSLLPSKGNLLITEIVDGTLSGGK
jgi:hypothetical protein